jgi:hypothetical protein
MTTPDYRTALQKLLNEIHELRLEAGNHSLRSAVIEARAALAEPEPPANGEIAELVEELGLMASHAAAACQFGDAKYLTDAADLLFRLAPQPVPEGPTDDELYEIWNLEGNEADFQDCRRFARAVLARWGHAPAATPGA